MGYRAKLSKPAKFYFGSVITKKKKLTIKLEMGITIKHNIINIPVI